MFSANHCFFLHGHSGGEREWNQAWAIDYWLNKAQVPRHKIVVGIPTYGMSFTLENARDNGLKAKANGGGDKGKYTGESGILSYYEVTRTVSLQNQCATSIFWNNVRAT